LILFTLADTGIDSKLICCYLPDNTKIEGGITMPRKTKTEAATKTTAVSKAKTKSITETPKHSEIILEYSRCGNIGISQVVETVDISFLKQKKFAGRITALFHFIRNTSVSHDFDSGRTATFEIDGKPVISITQKSGDYDEQVFSVTKYRADSAKQSTRKYPYNKTKNLILQAYGFEIKSNADTDEESEDIKDDEMLDTGNDTELLLPDTENFDDGIDSEFDEME